MNSLSLPCLGNLNIYISVEGFIMQLHLNYICVFIDIFVHLRMVYVMLCLYMLYNILVGYTSSWFLFYISPVYGSFQQCVIVISVIVFFFVNVISIFTAICLCTSCYLLLGCTKSWESWSAYLHYIICYAIFPS